MLGTNNEVPDLQKGMRAQAMLYYLRGTNIIYNMGVWVKCMLLFALELQLWCVSPIS